MKKNNTIIIILVLALLFSSCANSTGKNDSSKESSKSEIKTTLNNCDTCLPGNKPNWNDLESKETKESDSSALDKMSLEDIAKKLSDGLEMPEVENIKVEKDLYPNYIFTEYIEGSQALANEAMMSSVAHSAVILKLPEGSNVEKIRSEIEKNVDPTKWVCVSAEKVEVVNNGNYILLVMSFTDIVDTMTEKFLEIK